MSLLGAEPGLRERKKLATRAALGEAALRLALERGLANVLVEDIAAEVNVSPRTFNNYFSSKEDAVLSTVLSRAGRLHEALEARPLSEPLWDALVMAIAVQFPHDSEMRVWRLQVQLVKDTPALASARMRVFTAIERSLATEIVRRVGVDAEPDLYPRLLAGAVSTAVRVTLDHWLDCDPSTPLDRLLEHALRELQSGLPPPAGDPSIGVGRS